MYLTYVLTVYVDGCKVGGSKVRRSSVIIRECLEGEGGRRKGNKREREKERDKNKMEWSDLQFCGDNFSIVLCRMSLSGPVSRRVSSPDIRRT